MKNKTKEELGKSMFQIGNIGSGALILPKMFDYLTNPESSDILMLGVIAACFWVLFHVMGGVILESLEEEE